MASFVQRMIGAARLDVATYEEVENDTTATGQALAVVVMSSLASGVALRGEHAGFIAGLVAALIGWVVWAFATYFIGTRLLRAPGTRADLGQLLRAIGFAQSPGLLRVLGVIPLLGWLVTVITGVWIVIAFVIAVRQALDYESTGRAVAVCVIGLVVYVAFTTLIFALFGGLLPGGMP